MTTKNFVNLELFNNGPIVIFVWKNEEFWPVQAVSRNLSKQFGYEVDEFTSGKIHYLDLIHPENLKKVSQEVIENSEILNSDNFIHEPYKIKHKDGTYRWVRDFTTIIRNKDKITHYVGYLLDITNEIELKEENERSRLALQSINDGLWDWNLKTNKVYFSPLLKKMIGFEDNEIKDDLAEWVQRIHPEDKDNTFQELNNYIYGKSSSYSNEHRLLCKDNTYKWILDRGEIVEYDSKNKPLRMIGTHTDISQRKKYELELIQSEAKFAQMFKTHSSIMLLVNPLNGDIVDANIAASNFYGYSIDELKNLNMSMICCANPQEGILNRNDALNNEKNYFQLKHKLKDGTIKDIEIYTSPVKVNSHTLLFSIIHDITIRKKLKKQILDEKNFVTDIIDSASSIICVIDKNGKMIKFNEYAQKFTGYTEEEISKRAFTWLKLFPKNERQIFKSFFIKLKSNQSNKTRIVAKIKSRIGEIRYFEWSLSSVRYEDIELKYIICVGIDITSQEEQKKILVRQKKEFETIFNNAKDGIAIINLEGLFLEFNDEFMNICGYNREELLEKSTFDLTIKAESDSAKRILKEVKKEGYKKNYERTIIHKNGETLILNLSTSLMPDKKRILITAKDITKDKIFEQQSKLASMGEMIGNIAHQWRQPLSIINAVSSNIKLFEQLGNGVQGEELIKNMDTINEQVQYLSKTIDDFRNFIKDAKNKEYIKLINVLSKALQILKPSLDSNNIELAVCLDYDLEIEAYTNELIQALINIINNSKDAMNHNNESKRKLLFISTVMIDDKIALEIKDNGGGIDNKHKDKIFEPYFTTKHQSIGTGIGLSMTYKILTQHHNFKIEVSNQEYKYMGVEQKGLSFRIIF